MALDKNTLSTRLLEMMNAASAQSWTPKQVATAMADAIDTYVRGGDVRDVKVTLPGGGTATQTTVVHLS